MTRTEAAALHVAVALVGGTGLVYGWMLFLCEPADELALVNHPLQPAFQALHVLVAPLLVLAVGIVWSAHVWARVRSRYPGRRPTGLALFALFLPMALSGAWVQVAEGELGRSLASWTHGISGTLFCVVYAVHLLSRRGPDAVARAARR